MKTAMKRRGDEASSKIDFFIRHILDKSCTNHSFNTYVCGVGSLCEGGLWGKGGGEVGLLVDFDVDEVQVGTGAVHPGVDSGVEDDIEGHADG